MKKTFQKFLCGVMASVLLLSGCGGQDSASVVQESKSEAADSGAGQSGFDEKGISAEGEFPIVEEPIELTVMVPTQTNVQDITTNEFTTWYQDKTNIKINWIVVPQESLTEKVNISLSSGDMPDIYLSCNITQTQQQVYGMQGAFVPLNDCINTYGSVFKEIESQVPGLEEIMTMSDGNIYALPYIEKCVHCENSSKLWVNRNWLEKLNIEPPATVDEFEEMLRAFKEQDPNGNGIADEIPLLTFEGGWHSDALGGWLTNPFVYTAPDNKYTYLNDGTVEFSYMQDGWKDAMKWLNGLYQEGLYYDQSLIINPEQAKRVGASGDGVQVVGCFTAGTADPVASDLWADYIALAPIEGDAGRFATWMPYSQITPTTFVISSTCKYPEAAFRWAVEQYNLDICFRKVFGEEGKGWEFITPGEGDIPADAVDLNSGEASEVAILTNWGDEQNACWRGLGLRCDTPDAPAFRYKQYQVGDYETNMEYRLSFDTKEAMQPYLPDISVCMPPLVYDEAQATQLANIESVIIDYVKEMAARFITGDLDVEMEWDSYLKELEVKGMSNLKEIYQAAYDVKYK